MDFFADRTRCAAAQIAEGEGRLNAINVAQYSSTM